MDAASIASDRVHGAAYLTARAAEVLLATLGSGGDVARIAVELVKAQPAMAPLFTLANRVLLCDDPGSVRAVLRDFLDNAEPRLDRAAATAAARIRPYGTILTHSHSATVERTLLHARCRTIVTESRPLREGVGLARALGRAGLPVRVIVDAGAFRFMQDVDAVLVGADAVSSTAVVNKIGTGALALSAREAGKPVFAVCTSDKLLPCGIAPQPDQLRAPEEIVPERIAGIAVSNFYFDTTPLEWFATILTDEGELSPAEARSRIAGWPAHSLLLEAFA